jgi:hypothetical protein
VDTTDEMTFDGSIESAISQLIQPETEEQPAETAEIEEVEEDEEDYEDEGEEGEEPEEEGEDDVEDTEDAGSEEPKTFSVKVDGVEKRVTLEDLKQGYSGQQYVQQGMQQVAEMRKQFEQIAGDFLNEREQAKAIFAQVQNMQVPSPPVPPNEDNFTSDPIGFLEAQMKYSREAKEHQEKIAEVQQALTGNSKAEEQVRNAYLQREMETLRQVIPDFADPEKAQNLRNNMFKVSQETYGFDPQEISAITDSRVLRVLHDAMQFRAAQGGKEQAIKKAKAKPRRTVKPGAKKTSSNRDSQAKARSNLKRSGSIQDAMSLILEGN